MGGRQVVWAMALPSPATSIHPLGMIFYFKVLSLPCGLNFFTVNPDFGMATLHI